MSLDPAHLKAIIQLEPEAAIHYLESKGFKIGWDWRETLDSAHASAFTVAKAARLDILQDIHSALMTSLTDGTTLQQFTRDLTPTLQAKGWWGKQVIVDSQGNAEMVQLGSPRRLATIYQTNLQSAYMAGRYQEMMAASADRPYWQYIAVLDGRTRASHRAMNGKVFRFDDPIWQIIFPPNGFNCRCRVRGLTEENLKAWGLTVESSAGRLFQIDKDLGIDKQTGEMLTTQVTGIKVVGADGKTFTFAPDAGFNSGPAARYQPNLEKYDYRTARQYVSDTLRGPDFESWYRNTQELVDQLKGTGADLAAMRATIAVGQRFPVAVLNASERELLGGKSQTVWLSDETLVKQLVNRNGQNFELADYWHVQEILESPTLIIAERDYHLRFVKQGDRWWAAIVKVTKDGKENWLQSFYPSNDKEIERLRKTGKVIWEG